MQTFVTLIIVVILGIAFIRGRVKIKTLKEKIASLEVLATHDPLTGTLNRRGGEEALAHHLSLLERDNSPDNCFAIITLDLDRFKSVNDTHGHAVGDMVLKFTVQLLSLCLRKEHDIIVRTGGDEFYVIAPKCNYEGARVIRKKIKTLFERTPFVTENMELSISVSIGTAVSHNKDRQLQNLQILFDHADKELYSDKAKRK